MNGRDISTDPQPGDTATRREAPDRIITRRFTDATGQECIWYTEEHFMTVKAWTRWFKRSGALRGTRTDTRDS